MSTTPDNVSQNKGRQAAPTIVDIKEPDTLDSHVPADFQGAYGMFRGGRVGTHKENVLLNEWNGDINPRLPEGVKRVKKQGVEALLDPLVRGIVFGPLGATFSHAHVYGDTVLIGKGGASIAIIDFPDGKFYGRRHGVWSKPTLPPDECALIVSTMAQDGVEALRSFGNETTKNNMWLETQRHNLREIMREMNGGRKARMIEVTNPPPMSANVRRIFDQELKQASQQLGNPGLVGLYMQKTGDDSFGTYLRGDPAMQQGAPAQTPAQNDVMTPHTPFGYANPAMAQPSAQQTQPGLQPEQQQTRRNVAPTVKGRAIDMAQTVDQPAYSAQKTPPQPFDRKAGHTAGTGTESNPAVVEQEVVRNMRESAARPGKPSDPATQVPAMEGKTEKGPALAGPAEATPSAPEVAGEDMGIGASRWFSEAAKRRATDAVFEPADALATSFMRKEPSKPGEPKLPEAPAPKALPPRGGPSGLR